ncbi:GGDEF domain-containing protein [Roseateles sp.]|uniref:GGDEF domain-containing protein n=1 Tax=Roseateles sp. TaxID=1971397 RepID=UPI00395591D8
MSSPSSHDDLTAVRMRTLLLRAPLAVAFVVNDSFAVVSEHFSHLFGHGDDADLTGGSIRQVLTNDTAHASLREKAHAAALAGRPFDEEVECARRDGSRFWARLQVTPLHWEAPEGEAMWVVEDVTAARAQRLQPTWTAKHDSLTELVNRREFERRLSEHVGSRRGEPVSVLAVDVDNFSEVVKGMGAEVGDHFLYGLGQLLQAKVRASDLVARLEEDHFAVLLPDCDSHYAEIVAEKVRSAIAGYRLHWGLHRARVKASIGVVQVQPTLDTPEGVIGAATMACAEAKAAGGDSVRVFVSSGAFDQLAG